jgi:hypothetical protein
MRANIITIFTGGTAASLLLAPAKGTAMPVIGFLNAGATDMLKLAARDRLLAAYACETIE